VFDMSACSHDEGLQCFVYLVLRSILLFFCRGVGDISPRVLEFANMPSEKRALDLNEIERSNHHKRSKRDDQSRDWRAAHLDENKHKNYMDTHSRDRSLDRDRDRDRGGSHRSRDDRHTSSSARKGENKALNSVRVDSGSIHTSSFTRLPPTGPKAMTLSTSGVQRLAMADDEREEGEYVKYLVSRLDTDRILEYPPV
jgi:hypothetical protein